jgi:import inner membrane translocase subunit TIM23
MSFLSGLFGGSNTTQTPSSSPTDAEFTSSADLFNATSFSSNVKGSQPGSALPYASSSSGSSSGSASGSGSFSASAAAASGLPPAPTALDTFSTAYDPAKLHPLAGLGDKLDFLQLDEDKLTEIQGAATVLPSRGWTDDLCVGTGTTYLSGEYIHFDV